jgi:hypothetical protein
MSFPQRPIFSRQLYNTPPPPMKKESDELINYYKTVFQLDIVDVGDRLKLFNDFIYHTEVQLFWQFITANPHIPKMLAFNHFRIAIKQALNTRKQ